MAIGKLFEFRGKQIIPKDDCWQMLPLRAAFEKWPDEIEKICYYLHAMNSYRIDDNPYGDVPIYERSDQIVSDLGIEADVQDGVMLRALSCVEDKYYTTFYGLYTGIKASMDKIGKGLKTTEIDFNSRDGNVANIIRLMKDYEAFRSSFKTAYRDFDEETGNVKVRGNSKMAIDENDDDDDDE